MSLSQNQVSNLFFESLGKSKLVIWQITVFAMLLTAPVSFAQNVITISGRVLNRAQTPLPDVRVSLAKDSAITTTTDTAGNFSFSITEILNRQIEFNTNNRMLIKNGSFAMKIVTPVNSLRFTMFDIQGRQVFNASYTNPKVGSLNIGNCNLAFGAYLIRVTLDNETKTIRFFNINSTLNIPFGSNALSAKLAKQKANAKVLVNVWNDVLTINKQGYYEKNISLDSAKTQLGDIYLDTFPKIVPKSTFSDSSLCILSLS
jgi:hypothetical protein